MSRTAICLLGIFAALLIGVGTGRGVNVYDEGIILVGAARVAAGEVMHRDFYANYGPGQFYVLAALFKLFGELVWVERLWDMLVKGGIAATACVIVGRATSWPRGLLAYLLIIAFLILADVPGYPVFPALLCSLLGVLLLHRFLVAENGRRTLFLSGVMTGAAALFRYDIGFFACAAGLIALAGWLFASHRDGRMGAGERVQVLAVYVAGALAIVLPLMLAYLAGGFMRQFVFDVITFPAQNYARMRSLPFPDVQALLRSPADAVIYLPLLACAAAVPVIVRSLWHPVRSAGGGARPDGGGRAGADLWLLVILIPVVLAFYMKGYVRVSVIHMALSIVPAILMLVVISWRPARTGVVGSAVALLAAAALLASLSASWPKLMSGLHQYRVLLSGVGNAAADASSIAEQGSCSVPPSLARLRCLAFGASRVQAIQYVQARVRPADELFVGLTRHDKVFVNDVSLYFLAGMRPATRWHHYDPGLQTTQRIQRQMVDELTRRKPPFAILSSDWDGAAEPNESALSSGVTVLDDFLQERYALDATFGTIQVWRRR